MLNSKLKTFVAGILCMLMLALAAIPAAALEYPIPVGEETITLPLKGLAPGARSTNCWTFAQTVYKAVWGVSFSGLRGDKDDMLREIPTGRARAITAENTKNFFTAAPLGATVRITDTVNGDDNQGRYKHSFILIGKDENGFTSYEGSVNGRVRIKYFTWSAFANGYFGRNYRYFKYIKWPDAPTYAQILAAHTTATSVPTEALLLDAESFPSDAALEEAAALPEFDLNAATDLLPNDDRLADFSPGDVDEDGAITAADARLILRHVVQLETFAPGTAAFYACDANCDGAITSDDARTIMRLAVGLAEDN